MARSFGMEMFGLIYKHYKISGDMALIYGRKRGNINPKWYKYYHLPHDMATSITEVQVIEILADAVTNLRNELELIKDDYGIED